MTSDRKDDPGAAVVFGASGGIGSALLAELRSRRAGAPVLGLSRRGDPPLDLQDETSIAAAVAKAAELGEIRLAVIATGALHAPGLAPEKSLSRVTPEGLAAAFAVNTIGPALILKHLAPHLPRRGRVLVAALSARVGSIGDNRLGGWYGYRASKAALNQVIRTASIELARRNPEVLCVALHPGTVATSLSRPIVGDDPAAQAPEDAARRLLDVLDGLAPGDNGRFFDVRGEPVPW